MIHHVSVLWQDPIHAPRFLLPITLASKELGAAFVRMSGTAPGIQSLHLRKIDDVFFVGYLTRRNLKKPGKPENRAFTKIQDIFEVPIGFQGLSLSRFSKGSQKTPLGQIYRYIYRFPRLSSRVYLEAKVDFRP